MNVANMLALYAKDINRYLKAGRRRAIPLHPIQSVLQMCQHSSALQLKRDMDPGYPKNASVSDCNVAG